jgi:hypothetical protein
MMLPTPVRVEPLRVNPALDPLSVPPEFPKSTELVLANAVIGATANKNSHTILFIMTPFLPHSSELQVVVLRH